MNPADDEDKPPFRARSRVWLFAVLGAAALAAGLGLALLLRSEPAPPKAPRPRGGCIEQIEGDGEYTCARKRDGAVLCWGRKVPGLGEIERAPRQLTAFAHPAAKLFVELRSTCITTTDGALWCLGSNYDGQLHFPATQTSSRLPSKHSLSVVEQLTWSGQCAMTGGGLQCWEHTGTGAQRVTELPAEVQMVTGGSEFVCVLLVAGQVWCRGANTRGQLGILEGDTELERAYFQSMGLADFTPLRSLGSDVRRIASSRRHTCALKANSTVWCWGENQRGQIGKGDVSECDFKNARLICTPEEGLVPAQVHGLPRNIASLELGETTSCAIDQQGGVWCWGSLPEPTPVATRLDTPEPAKAITIADDVCLLSTSGNVYCRTFARGLVDWSEAAELDFGCP